MDSPDWFYKPLSLKGKRKSSSWTLYLSLSLRPFIGTLYIQGFLFAPSEWLTKRLRKTNRNWYRMVKCFHLLGKLHFHHQSHFFYDERKLRNDQFYIDRGKSCPSPPTGMTGWCSAPSSSSIFTPYRVEPEEKPDGAESWQSNPDKTTWREFLR